MPVSLDNQLLVVDRFFYDALQCIIQELFARRRDLLHITLKRVAEVGFPQYGDAAFHKSDLELRQDSDEELSDLIFYHCVRLAQEAGYAGCADTTDSAT